jgi:hypothetical protein
MITAKFILESINLPQLNERLVSNLSEISEFISELQGQFFQDTAIERKVDAWLLTVLYNYLKEKHEDVSLTTTRPGRYADSDLKVAFQRGVPIYHIILTKGLEEDLIGVINYFLSGEAPPGFGKMSVPDAIQKAKKWSDSYKKSNLYRGTEGTELVMEMSHGYKWVKIISKEALEFEGNLMQNCVKRVDRWMGPIESGHMIFYSLRGPNNEPFVDIRVERDDVMEIKGKNNKPPVERYWDYCVEFLNKMDFNNVHELDNIGAILFNKKVYLSKNAPNY